MSLRRLCNVAYAVLVDGVPVEYRAELDRRLASTYAEQEPEPVGITAEQKAEENRRAMGTLLGMLPGQVARA